VVEEIDLYRGVGLSIGAAIGIGVEKVLKYLDILNRIQNSLEMNSVIKWCTMGQTSGIDIWFK
ncbi:9507_t:CDS:2, partial [Gigaspora margarita]